MQSNILIGSDAFEKKPLSIEIYFCHISGSSNKAFLNTLVKNLLDENLVKND